MSALEPLLKESQDGAVATFSKATSLRQSSCQKVVPSKCSRPVHVEVAAGILGVAA